MSDNKPTAVVVLQGGIRFNIVNVAAEQAAAAMGIDPMQGVKFLVPPKGGGKPVEVFVRAGAIVCVAPPNAAPS